MPTLPGRRVTHVTCWLAVVLLCPTPLQAQSVAEATARMSLRAVATSGADSGMFFLALSIPGKTNVAQRPLRLDHVTLRDDQGRRYTARGVTHRAHSRAPFGLPTAYGDAAPVAAVEPEYVFLVPSARQRYELLLPGLKPVPVRVTSTTLTR